MILIFLFIHQCLAVTLIEFGQSSLWLQYDNVANENKYLIPKSSFPQYYIKVALDEQDPQFQVIITLEQPYDPNNNKRNNYSDYISQMENRLTRFIKIQPQGDDINKDIYITIIGQIYQEYAIQIIKSNEDLCPNDCNYKGLCQNNKCKCYQSYFGNDCHQQAKEFIINKDKQIYLQKDILNYFYISINTLQNYTNDFELKLETNNINQTILIQSQQEIYYLPYNGNILDKKAYNIIKINQNYPQITHIQRDIQNNYPILFIGISQGQDSILNITYLRNTQSNSLSWYMIIIVFLPGIGSLIYIITMIGYKCYEKNQQLSEKNKEGQGVELQSYPTIDTPQKEDQKLNNKNENNQYQPGRQQNQENPEKQMSDVLSSEDQKRENVQNEQDDVKVSKILNPCYYCTQSKDDPNIDHTPCKLKEAEDQLEYQMI